MCTTYSVCVVLIVYNKVIKGGDDLVLEEPRLVPSGVGCLGPALSGALSQSEATRRRRCVNHCLCCFASDLGSSKHAKVT